MLYEVITDMGLDLTFGREGLDALCRVLAEADFPDSALYDAAHPHVRNNFV